MEELRKSRDELETKANSLESRLSGLAGADKRQDLLRMELDTAEKRIDELSTQVRELEKKCREEGGLILQNIFFKILYKCITHFMQPSLPTASAP